MTEYYMTVCINLDKRDSEGKPTIIKTPKENITVLTSDTVHFTFSIINKGAEKEIATYHLKPTTLTQEEAMQLEEACTQ
jgi:hypothetical protein